MRAEGAPLRAIADTLTAEGVEISFRGVKNILDSDSIAQSGASLPRNGLPLT
jgi:hypothetical protein